MRSELKQGPVVAFDARLAIGKYRGMGRFVRRMVQGYEERFIAFTGPGETDPGLNVISGGVAPYPFWEQISLPQLSRKHCVDYLFCPYNTAPLFLHKNIRLILAVHDFIYMQPTSKLPFSSSVYQNVGRFYRRAVVPNVLKQARFILTVSQVTRRQILDHCPNVQHRIVVIPNTIADSWFVNGRVVAPSQSLILCPSGEAPSKNLNKAIAAFARYVHFQSRTEIRMLVTGVKPAYHDSFQATARRLGVGSQVEFAGYLPEKELQLLYRQASLCFVASSHEGFGIPVLEAMASGTPVVLSDIPSFREVAGQAGLYFNEESVEDMSEKLRVIDDEKFLSTMRMKVLSEAQRFSPQIVDAKIRDFWALLLGAD
jgi:glycosyltransferase involved in cell wall biosynthesis